MKEKETEEVHFICPKDLLSEFDEAWQGRHGNRTAALLDLMREFIKYRKAAKAAKEA